LSEFKYSPTQVCPLISRLSSPSPFVPSDLIYWNHSLPISLCIENLPSILSSWARSDTNTLIFLEAIRNMPPYPVSNQLNMQQSPLVLILLISSSLRDLRISSFSSKWGTPRLTHFPLDIVLPSRSCGSELDEKSMKSCSPTLNLR